MAITIHIFSIRLNILDYDYWNKKNEVLKSYRFSGLATWMLLLEGKTEKERGYLEKQNIPCWFCSWWNDTLILVS